jgi:hypothetical protein
MATHEDRAMAAAWEVLRKHAPSATAFMEKNADPKLREAIEGRAAVIAETIRPFLDAEVDAQVRLEQGRWQAAVDRLVGAYGHPRIADQVPRAHDPVDGAEAAIGTAIDAEHTRWVQLSLEVESLRRARAQTAADLGEISESLMRLGTMLQEIRAVAARRVGPAGG